ncbi:MAG: ribose-phosphate pyrophosphokinase [Verrucomicrobia bacterium]|nr:ribose-phosphate pyrophosphokinase [Verrucomicrobiota bacterium]
MRALLITISLFFCCLNAADYKIFSGSSNLLLAEEVAKHLGVPLSPVTLDHFNDGEIRIKIEENIRNCDVYLIQSTCGSDTGTVNDSLMELYLMIRTMVRSSAGKITVIIPYYGYARQDRKTTSRVPISASDIAMLIEDAGADHVISVDLHCGQIQGFFHHSPVDNLYAAPVFVRYFAEKSDLVDPVVISPDAGGVERAKKFIEGLSWRGIDAGLAVILKQRAGAGVVEKMNLVGNVEGRDAIIIDDICDTAGTLVQAAEELKKHGARRIYACITHGIFSGPAMQRIDNSPFDELIVTDTIPLKTTLPANVVQLSVASLIAESIERNYRGESISHLFTYKGSGP